MNTITTIYHFANTDEGLPVLQSYVQCALPLELKFVFSSINQRKTSRNPLKQIYHHLQWIKHKRYIKNLLKDIKAEILFVDDVNAPEFTQTIKANSCLICSGYTQIFKTELLSKFDLKFNVHHSILPFYRGPVPNYWVIKNKEKFTGYSIHEMTPSIDDGEILFQELYKVDSQDPGQLQHNMARFIASSFQDKLKSLVTEKDIIRSQLDPKEVYNTHVGYMGFPDT